MTAPVFAFSAYSGTGKTTLIEKIVENLTRRGLQVAVIKHDAHRFEIDREGKDSWRFTQAGAKLTMISSPEKTAAICQEGMGIHQLLSSVEGVDIILVEGWKNEDLPRIGIARKATGKGFTAPAEAFLATVSDYRLPAGAVPAFGLDQIDAICDFLLEKAGFPKISASATAAGRVFPDPETFALLRSRGAEGGPVTMAQIAAIAGADSAPLPRPPAGTALKMRLDRSRRCIEIEAVALNDGGETDALCAVSAAAVAICRLCKKGAQVRDIRLLDGFDD